MEGLANLSEQYLERMNAALDIGDSVISTLQFCERQLEDAEEQEDVINAGESCWDRLSELSTEMGLMNEDELHIFYGENLGAVAAQMLGTPSPEFVLKELCKRVAIYRQFGAVDNIRSVLSARSSEQATELWPLLKRPSDRAIRECLIHTKGVFMGSDEERRYFFCPLSATYEALVHIALAYALVDGSIPHSLGIDSPEKFVEVANSSGYQDAVLYG
jgi:hypothetical protein